MIKSRKLAPHQSLSRSVMAGATLATGLGMAFVANADAPVGDAHVKHLGHVEVKGKREHLPDRAESDKFTQKLQDTPQTIQVITKDLFNQQGATTLTEALRNSPGVGTFYAGENGNTATGDTVYMRGFDSSSSLFVDGVRDIGSVARDLFNVDRVEVFKGPAGTDNGRTPPSGAINMVSKRAKLRRDASASITVGTDSQRRATFDLNTPLSMPGAALRVNVVGQNSGVPGRDHVRNQRWGVAPSLGFGLDTDTRAYLNLLYVQQNNVPDGYVPTIGLPGWTPQPGLEALVGHPVDSSNFYGTRSDYEDTTGKMATLRVEHEVSDALLVSNTLRWGETRQDYMLTAFMSTGNSSTGAPGNIRYTDVNDLSSYTLRRSNPTFKDITNEILTNQFNVNANFRTGTIGHALSTGIELTREKQTSLGRAVTNGTIWTPANLYQPDWNATGLTWAYNGADGFGETQTASIYAFDTLSFGERLLVTAGVRADRYNTEFRNSVACTVSAKNCGSNAVGTVVPGVDLESSDTLLNWKLGAVYKLNPTVNLYTNFAVSQQPPGGSNFDLSAAANNLNNPNMDPQQARTAEIGAKFAFNRDRFFVDAALFRTQVLNEINTQDLDSNGNPTQTGEKLVRGAELTATGNLTRHWSVSAGYTYMDTEVRKGAGVTADGSGDLAYTPGSAITTWSTYRFPFGLTLGGGARYNEGLRRGTDGAVGTPAFTKSYTVWDAVASFDVTPDLSLRLNAYNLFDKQYVASINKSGYRYLPGTPRTFTLTADFRF